MTPQGRYERLVATMTANPEVTNLSRGKGFGSTGQLKVKNRIFAMLVRDELAAIGEGRRFDAGKGTPMREWFVLSPTSKRPWLSLAREAHDFVNEKS